jgi:peptide/nickel transport system substrate-binding protein
MKKLLILLLVAVIGSFAFAQEDGGVLEIATVSEPTSLDPITTNNVPSRIILMQIHDSLVAYDENLSVVPKLASS